MGVAICIVLVWSPDTIELVRTPFETSVKGLHREEAFSPRIGSKILINGFESWFSR